MSRLLCLTCVFCVSACAFPGRVVLLADPIRPTPSTPLITAQRARQEPSRRAAVVEKARRLLAGEPMEADGYTFEPNPIGFVRAAYWSVGIDLFVDDAGSADLGMPRLFRSVADTGSLHEEEPRPGDLVFFDERPGAEASAPSGVAVVELVQENGTVVAIGAFAQGPRRITMNLTSPKDETSREGVRLNDVLVGNSRATAAQLWRCYADPF